MKMFQAIFLGIGIIALAGTPSTAAESCVTAKCHPTLTAAKGVVLHDPVAGGDCSSCHEASGIPHPGKKGGFTLTADGAALCEQCHDSMSKGKKVVHPALEDGCVACHNPHRSKNRKLLVATGSDLCITCHDDPAKGMKSVHPIIRDEGCTACHTPHAGDNPKLLLATGVALCNQCHDGLLQGAKVVHSPAGEGECLSCHNPHASKAAKLTVEPGAQLCEQCHDSKSKDSKGQLLSVLHPPVADGDCTACHTPHGSSTKGLLRSAPPTLCEECHDSKSKDSKGQIFPVLHPPVADGDCTACHTPHGSSTQGLLRVAPPVLCEECHDSKGKGRSSVHTPVRDGECMSCHAPHGAAKKGLLAKSGVALCSECHEAKATEKVKHPPAIDDCQSCHDVHSTNVKNQLLAPGNDLCYSCHDDKETLKTMKNVHPIVADSCLNCHRPHSGPEKAMLPARGDKLCASCHEDVARIAVSSVSQHAAVADGGCEACHDPHGSGRTKMLVEAEGVLCLSCHDAIQARISSARSQHQPVRDGECVACHNPHGAAVKPLLKGNFPDTFYVGYNAESYSLCFSCHPKGIAEYSRTSLTKFSNGDRNLHELHINKDKGRTCRVCHSVHGGDQERLVRFTSPSFGKWAVPINFTLTESGGTCLVGCHKPKSYNRFRPVTYR